MLKPARWIVILLMIALLSLVSSKSVFAKQIAISFTRNPAGQITAVTVNTRTARNEVKVGLDGTGIEFTGVTQNGITTIPFNSGLPGFANQTGTVTITIRGETWTIRTGGNVPAIHKSDQQQEAEKRQ